ncbi:MAG TPA: ABC transporter permease [Acidimicrobiales bacterium]|nr:ABC transporter permease [Acidimicrobiales bacterium]
MTAVRDAGAATTRFLRGGGASAAAAWVFIWLAAIVVYPNLLNLALPGRMPTGIVAYGVVIGALYGLIAMGLILVYRANQVVNFAQAGLGAAPATLGVVLVTTKGWPYWAALLLVVVGSLVLGGLVDFLVVRRFTQAPRLILAVVTIGIGQLLAYVEFNIPGWITGDALPPADFPTPFSSWRFTFGGTVLKGDHVVALLVVGVIVVALGLFFRLTRIGIAVRASAENAERASLLGVPVRRVSTLVWMLAALLSAVGIFLRAPLVGLSFGTIIGPSVLLYALAAAMVARMQSLPVAFVAGMAIGGMDFAMYYSTRNSVLSQAMMLPIILVALLLQRQSAGRAHDTGVTTWRTVKEFRPIPSELRNVREVLGARTLVLALAAGLAVGLPFLVGRLYRNDASLLLIYAMVGVSLVVLTGWAGQISLGQFAFVGVGAGVAGGLAANHQADFFVTIIVAGMVGAVVAVLVGLPALRVQGLFLAVTTLAFAGTTQAFLLDRRFFGWMLPPEGGIVYRPKIYGRIDTGNDLVFYYVCLVFLVLMIVMARQIRSSRSGRVMIAVRANPRAAQSYGVNLSRTRLAAFAISGFMAAVAGALFVYQQGALDVNAYPPVDSIKVFAMTVVGGLTSVGGAVAGAAYLIVFQRFPFFRTIEFFDLLTTGVGLMVLLLFFPGGLAELGYRARDSFLRWVAARRGIHVPSLVADSLEEQGRPVSGTDPDLLTEVGEEVGAGRALLELPDSVIICPACEEHVPVERVATHEHFRPEAARLRARRSRHRVRAVAAEDDLVIEEVRR